MPDADLASAISHWAPRFVAQGVEYNDFLRTTTPLRRWDEWLDAWTVTGDSHAALAREAQAADHRVTAGEAYVRAALCYHFAKFLWLLDLRRHRDAADRAVAALYTAHRLLDPSAERVEVSLEGAILPGNLRKPPTAGPHPVVMLIPGLDSAKEEFFAWENVFLTRGLATLSLDGPGQGEAGYATAIRHDYEVAVSAALDALAGRRDLDLSRVGAAGVSLGGYYALRTAAFEPRIKAVAAIGGPYNFGECWDGLPALSRQAFVHYSGASGDADGRERALQLTLERVLPRVVQPLLVVFGKLDRLIPYQQAERVAAEAPNSELVMYPEGNHVCNNIPHKYRPRVADWLADRLAAR